MFLMLAAEYLGLIGFRNIRLFDQHHFTGRSVDFSDDDIVIAENQFEFMSSFGQKSSIDRHKTLVIVTTLDKDIRRHLSLIKSGMDAILLKPFTFTQLNQTLSGLLTSPAARRCKIVLLPCAAPVPSQQSRYIPLD